MNCKTCNNKGYFVSSIIKDSENYPLITKCPNPDCSYHSNYYQKIRDLYSESKKPVSDKLQDPSYLNDVEKAYRDYDPDKPIAKETSKLDQEDNNNLENPRSPQTPEASEIKAGPNQVPSNDTRQEVEVETSETYSYLPQDFVDSFTRAKKVKPDTVIVVDTPFGPYPCKHLPEANRIYGIIGEYQKYYKDLDYAMTQENVVVFPLHMALGF